MYSPSTTAPFLPAATLPLTGLSLTWTIIAAVTMIALGAALLRIGRELRHLAAGR